LQREEVEIESAVVFAETPEGVFSESPLNTPLPPLSLSLSLSLPPCGPLSVAALRRRRPRRPAPGR